MVPIDNLVPGMELAADLHDRNGRLLLKAGTELTERCLYLMHTWGAIEADIVKADSAPECPADAMDPEFIAAVEKKIAPLFLHTDPEHPAIKALMHIRIMMETDDGCR
ncbi:MAG TPA: hypothetical protein VMJ66_03465 [Geobacteraceae bacterium]|nr:hypothetical protein [Geobacteraceae bacterium]